MVVSIYTLHGTYMHNVTHFKSIYYLKMNVTIITNMFRFVKSIIPLIHVLYITRVRTNLKTVILGCGCFHGIWSISLSFFDGMESLVENVTFADNWVGRTSYVCFCHFSSSWLFRHSSDHTQFNFLIFISSP